LSLATASSKKSYADCRRAWKARACSR
jgi:hypothetical protein